MIVKFISQKFINSGWFKEVIAILNTNRSIYTIFLSFAIRLGNKDCKISIRWRHGILIPNGSWDGRNTEKTKTYNLWNQVCSVLPERTERGRKRTAVEFSWRDWSLFTKKKKNRKWMQEYGGGKKGNSRDWGGQRRMSCFRTVPTHHEIPQNLKGSSFKAQRAHRNLN